MKKSGITRSDEPHISSTSNFYGRDGQAARQMGFPVSSNPYEEGTVRYHRWRIGWQCEETRLCMSNGMMPENLGEGVRAMFQYLFLHAYQDGRAARSANAPIDSNPHTEYPLVAKAFDIGYDEMDAELAAEVS